MVVSHRGPRLWLDTGGATPEPEPESRDDNIDATTVVDGVGAVDGTGTSGDASAVATVSRARGRERDDSVHDWSEGRRAGAVLMVMIADATKSNLRAVPRVSNDGDRDMDIPGVCGARRFAAGVGRRSGQPP